MKIKLKPKAKAPSKIIEGAAKLKPLAAPFLNKLPKLFIGIADLHLSNHHGAGVVDKAGINSFLKLRKAIAIKAIKDAAQYNVPLIFAGDTIDTTSIDAVTAYAFHDIISLIRELDVRAYFISGNHEYDGIHNIIESYSNLNFTEIEFISKPTRMTYTQRDELGNVSHYISFYFIPYMGKIYKHTENAIEYNIQYAKTEANEKDGHPVYKIMVLHTPVIGMMYNVSLTLNKVMAPITTGVNLAAILKEHGNPFHAIIAGDIHERQFGHNINNFMYLGQPYWSEFAKRSLAKSTHRGINYFVLDEDNDIGVVLQSHPDAPVFHNIMVTDIKDVEKRLKKKKDVYYKGNVFKLDITEDASQYKDEITKLVNYLYERGCLKVVVRRMRAAATQEISPSKQLVEYYRMSFEEIVEHYVNKYVSEDKFTDEQIGQIKKTGSNILYEVENA